MMFDVHLKISGAPDAAVRAMQRRHDSPQAALNAGDAARNVLHRESSREITRGEPVSSKRERVNPRDFERIEKTSCHFSTKRCFRFSPAIVSNQTSGLLSGMTAVNEPGSGHSVAQQRQKLVPAGQADALPGKR